MFSDHRVAYLSSFHTIGCWDIQARSGLRVIQRVMLNHRKTTTPLGELVGITLFEGSCLHHQVSSYSPSMIIGSADCN